MKRAPRLGLHAAVLLLGTAAIGYQAGCQADKGSDYDCVCSCLTDFDDTSKQAVTVCAPSAERAPAVAHGCAQKWAPARVEGCSCQPASGGACSIGECRQR